jgi:glycerol 3-phosphatase-2
VLAASDGPLDQVYDAALLDLDGVLYLGQEPIAHAAAAVAAARANGMRAAFVTNNASRRPGAVAAHLTELGIPAEPRDVVTSGQAAVRWLAARLPAGAAVLVVGSDDLADEVAAGGLAPQRVAAGAAAVLQGLAPSTAWTDLAEASVAITAGALWVAGNTDSTYPSPRGPLPGNGALVQALMTATGQRPVVVGKPEPELHAASVERVGALRPLVVGDRLDTDILGAVRAGADSLLVLTGVTDLAALLSAPEGMRPTYVSRDLRGLQLAHPSPEVQGGTARCGQANAQWEGDRPVPSDDSDDALRAACALAWSRQ